MKSVLLLLPLLGSILLSEDSYAQTARKYSNEFLAIGVGARALGKSNAHVASVDDVTSGYWNPAGLLKVKSNIQVAAQHAEYFAGIAKYDYGAIAVPIDSSSALGVSVIRFGVDNIPNTTELIDADGNFNYDRITSFSAADYAFLISYARKPGIEGLSIGANAKIIHRTVGDFARAWGFGLDAGAQYERNGWLFGAMARDITSTFNAWNYTLSQNVIDVFEATGNEIPENGLEVTLPKLIIGAARKVIIKEKFSVMPEINMDFTFDGQRNVVISGDPISIDPNMGLELGYLDFIYLRAGVGNFQRVKAETGPHKVTTFQPNMGIGVRLRNFTIDYALTDIGDQSVALYSNIFSLKLDINKRTN